MEPRKRADGSRGAPWSRALQYGGGVRFGMLGTLEVWDTDGVSVLVPEAKVRMLLAVLLISEGHPVSADRLAHSLWGEALPTKPARVLRAKLSRLRAALGNAEADGRARIVHDPSGYRLVAGADEVDALRFRSLLERAQRTAELRPKADTLAEALDLWRGAALADFADVPFAGPAAARLEEERLTAQEEHAEVRLELGEHRLLADELGDLAGAHPLRERLRAAHMRALYRSGRQAEALAAFEGLRVRLAEELGADPGPEIAALHQEILRQDPGLAIPTAPGPVVVHPRTNLPAPLTEIIGRERETERVRELLRDGRLVTLVGPGGVGKTRLALAAAEGIRDGPDGVWFVQLGWLPASGSAEETGTAEAVSTSVPPSGSERVAEAVASVLGLRISADTSQGGPVAWLSAALRGVRGFIVLDNCEHVIDDVAELVRGLLAEVPGVRCLATSRESLGITGERIVDVAPLAVPAEDAAEEPTAAVRLFVARASAGAPNFVYDERTAPTIAAICRRLDGLPLALELAANRVRALGVDALAERLDDRFALLASGERGAPRRQQTLRAVVDWSWDLLTGPERAVLRRMSVHAGTWTLEAAEAVAGKDGVGPVGIFNPLARLVERSLVAVVDGEEGPRYRLLESIAAYAAEKLDEAGETAATRERHLRYYLELAERADPLLRGPGQRHWLHHLDRSSADLRVAFDSAVHDGDADTALRLATAPFWYRWLRGRLHEADRLLSRALELDGGSAALRAAAGAHHAGLVINGQELDIVAATAESALAAFDGTGDHAGRAYAEWFIGAALTERGAPEGAEGPLRRALSYFEEQGDNWGTAAALSNLSWLDYFQGKYRDSEAGARRALELFRDIGDGWGQVQVMSLLSNHAEMGGELLEVSRISRESLKLAEDLGLWQEATFWLCALGEDALNENDHDRAVDLFEQSKRLAITLGYTFGERHAELNLGTAAHRQGRLRDAVNHLRRWHEYSPKEEMPARFARALVDLGFSAERSGDTASALDAHLEGLGVARTADSPELTALALTGLAGAMHSLGDPERAARLLGATHTAHAPSASEPTEDQDEESRAREELSDEVRAEVERVETAVRATLTEEAFAAAFDSGRLADPGDVVAWAEDVSRREGKASFATGR